MDIVQIGIAGALVSEALKFIPILRQNSITKALTAIVVTLVIALFTSRTFSFEGFVAALIVALTTYTAVLQPVMKAAGASSQK